MKRNCQSIVKFPTDRHSHPPPKNAKGENIHKSFEKKLNSHWKSPGKRHIKFTKTFVPQMLQWFHRFSHSLKVPFTESELKIYPRYRNNPEIHSNKGRQTNYYQKFIKLKHDISNGVAIFATKKNEKQNVSRMFRDFMWRIHAHGSNHVRFLPGKWVDKNLYNVHLQVEKQRLTAEYFFEKWNQKLGKTRSPPILFPIWISYICSCGNGISTHFSKKRATFILGNQLMGISIKWSPVFCTRKMKNCVYLRSIQWRPLFPSKNCKFN